MNNLIKEQIKRQSKICSDTYYSITTCGMCPAINIVDVRDEAHKCHVCGWEDDISGFPDVFYEGMEYWCDLCECYSTISEETPWGTCLCS